MPMPPTPGTVPSPGPAWSEVISTWRPTPWVDAVVLVVAVLYLVGAARHRGPDGARWPVRRTVAAMAALAALVITTDSGIGVWGHAAFAVHMVMHLMLIMVVPVLWVAGHPLELLRGHLSGAPAPAWDRTMDSRIARGLTFGGTVLVGYGLVIVLTHLTGFMEAMAQSMALHHAEQVLYLVTGLWFFHTALGVDAIPRRPSYAARFALMMLAMGIDTLVGVVLMLAPPTMFPSYALEGVQLGGAIMWVGGDGLMMVIIVVLGRMAVADASQRVDFGPWLESARRSAFAEQTGTEVGSRSSTPSGTSGAARDFDDDEEALAAYNRMLARLGRGEGRG